MAQGDDTNMDTGVANRATARAQNTMGGGGPNAQVPFRFDSAAGTRFRHLIREHLSGTGKKLEGRQRDVADYLDPRETFGKQQATEAQDMYRDRSGIDTRRTPEMQRTEKFQRLADLYNNQVFNRSGVAGFGAGNNQGMPVGMQEQIASSINQREKMIDSEDARQQELNRQRHADKLEYQELGRHKEANDLLQRLWSMGVADINDLVKMAHMKTAEFHQILDVNDATLMQEFRHFASNMQSEQKLRDAAAELRISEANLVYILAAMQESPVIAQMVAGMIGIDTPAFMAVVLNRVPWLKDTMASLGQEGVGNAGNNRAGNN